MIRRAFTLVELLIVIAIFLILLAIAVPAFSSMLYSSAQSLAENSLRIALSTARDAAARAPKGQDVVAFFAYEPATKQTQIITCVRVGVILDPNPASRLPAVEREVFAPAPAIRPVQLPSGWSARGYAPAGTIDLQWYEKTYPSGTARNRGNWVFPETGFFNENVGNDGEDRQSFVIRFEGGTGVVKAADRTPILVLHPSVGTTFRSSSPWNLYPNATTGKFPFRVDLEGDPVRFVRRVLTAPGVGPGSLTIAQRQDLLGDKSSDTVLCKPVSVVALYNERRLAQGIRVSLDRTTESLYQNADEPRFVQTSSGPWQDLNTIQVNEWVEGHLRRNNQPVESDCRIFSVQRHLGWLEEITGTIGGQGVGQ